MTTPAPFADLGHACDCHVHINDPAYPYADDADLRPPPAPLAHYQAVQQASGLRRVVVIQPSSYGQDNRCTLDAVARLGDQARAVVVVDAHTPPDTLQQMHIQGARGVRFNLLRPSPLSVQAMTQVASRIAPLGWHLQLHASPDLIASLAPILRALPVPIVFDHLGRLPLEAPQAHPAFAVIQSLLQQERAWMKLSGVELDGAADAPDFAPAVQLARHFIRVAPSRLVWGSNWPHPAAACRGEPVPAFADLLHWLDPAIDDPAVRHAIFCANPGRLYGFHAAPAS